MNQLDSFDTFAHSIPFRVGSSSTRIARIAAVFYMPTGIGSTSSFRVAIMAASSTTLRPTGSILTFVDVSAPISTAATNGTFQSLEISAAYLGGVSSYTLAANTLYTLVMYLSSGSGASKMQMTHSPASANSSVTYGASSSIQAALLTSTPPPRCVYGWKSGTNPVGAWNAVSLCPNVAIIG